MDIKVNITVELVENLIKEQFPQWSHLSVTLVAVNGWDNSTFRLGNEMSVRLPSAQRYAAKVALEQKWLPILASHISVLIPAPLVLGQPSQEYPWQWSVYRWVDGESLNTIEHKNLDMCQLAQDLAKFLCELQAIDTTGGPVPGAHNFYRGDDLSVYEHETIEAISQLKDYIDIEAARSVWKQATNSTWQNVPVWLHGDMAAGNILIQNGKLAAVIDFGGMAVGDPACDLVLAWTLFTGPSRKIFKSHIRVDKDTWVRARGWALWKALITLAALPDKTDVKAQEQLRIIHEIFKDETV